MTSQSYRIIEGNGCENGDKSAPVSDAPQLKGRFVLLDTRCLAL